MVPCCLLAVPDPAAALLATWLGQAIGWYQSGETAGFFGALVGAVILLLIWRQLARPR